MASHQKVGCHNTINDQNGSISIIFEHCLSFRSGNSQLSSCIIIYHLEVGFHNYHHLSSFIIIYHLEVGFHNYHHLSFRSGIPQVSSFIIIYHLEVGFHNYHHLSSFIIIYHLEVGFHNYHHLSSFVIQKWDSTSIIIYHRLSFGSGISQLSFGECLGLFVCGGQKLFRLICSWVIHIVC